MSPRLRKLALAAHIALSVGWLGAVLAYLVLDLTVATSQDPQRLRGSYIAMGSIATWLIVPLAVASLLTGLVMSLGTGWGVFRHYWVLISLVLTVLALVVLVVETRTIDRLALAGADPATTDEELRALGSTLLHSIGGAVVLLVILVLNTVKPRGQTRYGWRKQQREAGV